MGCWNKTCGLTNLPIFAGEEVIVFLLIQSPITDARNCYASGLWNHIPLPLYGKYDDYGWLDPSPGQEWKLELLSKIYEKNLVRLVPKESDSGFVRYPTVNDNPFDSFEILGNSLHGSIFGIKNTTYTQGEKVSLLSDMFVHRASFNELVADNDFFGETTSVTRDEIIASVEQYVAWRNDILSDDSEEGVVRKIMLSYDGGIEEYSKTITPPPKHSWSFAGRDIIGMWFSSEGGSSVGWLTVRFVGECRHFNATIPIQEMLDGSYILDVMLGLRKSFHPPGGEGSQAGMWGLHKKFGEIYQNRVNEYLNDDEEEIDDDDIFEDEEE